MRYLVFAGSCWPAGKSKERKRRGPVKQAMQEEKAECDIGSSLAPFCSSFANYRYAGEQARWHINPSIGQGGGRF